jgi:SAM-dependent methyltransferase
MSSDRLPPSDAMPPRDPVLSTGGSLSFRGEPPTAAEPSMPLGDGPPASWDELASWWKTTFTGGADQEYEHQILPLVVDHLAGCSRILDLGTGEGQLARRLVGEGSGSAPKLVVGVDPSAGQLANAATAGGGPSYVRGRGESLPFAAASFDAVLCCLVIEHADDPDAVLADVARVLRPAGRFLLLVNHPIIQGPESGLV